MHHRDRDDLTLLLSQGGRKRRIVKGDRACGSIFQRVLTVYEDEGREPAPKRATSVIGSSWSY
jgi:hypothetical protein